MTDIILFFRNTILLFSKVERMESVTNNDELY